MIVSDGHMTGLSGNVTTVACLSAPSAVSMYGAPGFINSLYAGLAILSPSLSRCSLMMKLPALISYYMAAHGQNKCTGYFWQRKIENHKLRAVIHAIQQKSLDLKEGMIMNTTQAIAI